MQDAFNLVGRVLDQRFRVDALVGEGGFGVVYRGWHLRFNHSIAIKCLKIPGHFPADARDLCIIKFRQEGALLSALQSERIVRVFDFGVTSHEIPFLVLEWLDGEDLETRLLKERSLGKGCYTETEAIALLRPAMLALANAHSRQPEAIAHRDIKPANLFLSSSGLKVLDFGIAKVMQAGETATMMATKTSSGFSSFSPSYGAPEQFVSGKQGYGATGPWTDVHALALILVELVTGKPALDGNPSAPFSYFRAATSNERPTPRRRAPGLSVSDGFEAVCARALALRPSARYADATKLLAALDALSMRAPVAKRRSSTAASESHASLLSARTVRASAAMVAAAFVTMWLFLPEWIPWMSESEIAESKSAVSGAQEHHKAGGSADSTKRSKIQRIDQERITGSQSAKVEQTSSDNNEHRQPTSVLTRLAIVIVTVGIVGLVTLRSTSRSPPNLDARLLALEAHFQDMLSDEVSQEVHEDAVSLLDRLHSTKDRLASHRADLPSQQAWIAATASQRLDEIERELCSFSDEVTASGDPRDFERDVGRYFRRLSKLEDMLVAPEPPPEAVPVSSPDVRTPKVLIVVFWSVVLAMLGLIFNATRACLDILHK